MNTEIDTTTLSRCERSLYIALRMKEHFFVSSEAVPVLAQFAEAFDYQLIQVKLESLDDIKGRLVIDYERKSFDYVLDWAQPLSENPDVTYIVLFLIDENTDSSLIAKLKSYLDAHILSWGGKKCTNFFAGLIHNGSADIIPDTIKRLCYKIEWQ